MMEPVTEFIDELKLEDRVFLLGDIVSRSDAQLGQTGLVVGMRMYVDLKCTDGLVLRNVCTDLLQPLAACRPGALVLHAQCRWLGRVDEVYDNVQILFDDGASCKVRGCGAESVPPNTHVWSVCKKNQPRAMPRWRPRPNAHAATKPPSRGSSRSRLLRQRQDWRPGT